MLEMVVVLPLLLLLVFALVEFGIAFGRWLAINNAAREGARDAVLFRTDCDPATVEAEVIATVQAYTSNLGLTVPASAISVTGQCAGPGTDSTVSVTVQYAFQTLSGIAPSLGTSLTLSASSVMRNEG
jgi:Flp pilus assembly protein TadG